MASEKVGNLLAYQAAERSGNTWFPRQQMRCQGHPGEKTEEDWRGPGDSPVRPLALGFDSQVSAYFLEGHFQLPAQHKPLDDLGGRHVEVGTQ